MSLHYRVTVRDSASGLADQGGHPSVQEGGPEGVFQLLGIRLLGLGQILLSSTLEQTFPGYWRGEFDR